MSLDMYKVSIPTFIHKLQNLSAILKKAEDHANANGISPETLTTAKLAEDMFPLTRQVQIASDAAKGAAARLSGTEIPSFEDKETTFADLQSRIAKTISFLQTIKPESMEGSETKPVTLKYPNSTIEFDNGVDYLLKNAIPNFYFHVTTAYDILRNQGVTLGKKDYLGS